MSSRLCVYLYDLLVGHLEKAPESRVSFTYTPEWQDLWMRGDAHKISVSLPIQHDNPKLDATAFVAGLLPDSTRHRTLLADELGIGDDPSDFAFLAKLGRDCAGALTVVPEGEDLHRGAAAEIEWLDLEGLAAHLRALPRRPLMIDEDNGVVLSLAGVNDKAAVVVSRGRIGLPRYGFPSTHIIKVDIPGLEDSIKTEHFCLSLARKVGFRVPRTALHQAEDQSFMLMQRYDRQVIEGAPQRIHQEDFCQALNVMPGRKYQRHGGPSWPDCFRLMRETVNPTAARGELLREAVFQFLIGNPDAHAKNYSLVYSRPSGAIHLSPFYDLNNAAAFRALFKKARPLMAMKIGETDDRDEVTIDDWRRFASDCSITETAVADAVTDLAGEILEALPAVLEQVPRCAAIRLAAEDIAERCSRWTKKPEYPATDPAIGDPTF